MNVAEDRARLSRQRTLPVRIVVVTELRATLPAFDVPTAVVIDATDQAELPVTLLARLVRLRRAVRSSGGDLVLAAGQPVAHVLSRTGLLFAIPCYETVPEAVGSLNAAA